MDCLQNGCHYYSPYIHTLGSPLPQTLALAMWFSLINGTVVSRGSNKFMFIGECFLLLLEPFCPAEAQASLVEDEEPSRLLEGNRGPRCLTCRWAAERQWPQISHPTWSFRHGVRPILNHPAPTSQCRRELPSQYPDREKSVYLYMWI